MITERQGCVALGLPVPQGSMKCIGAGGVRHQLVDTKAKRLYVWRKQIQDAALEFFTEAADKDQPLTLIGHFYLPRPANQFRTGRYAHLLRDDAAVYPTGHQLGDTDKFLRAVGDALSHTELVPDDKQFVRVVGEKHYVRYDLLQQGLSEPGAQIEVRPR